MNPDANEKLARPQLPPRGGDGKSSDLLWRVVPGVLVLLTVWTDAHYPLDYWLHVNSGRWMVRQGRWMERDPFSHTIAGEPIDNQAWLAQIALYALHRAGGYALAQFAAGWIYAAGLWLVVRVAYRRCGDGRIAGLLGCAAALGMATNLGVRPQMFSVLLFAAQMVVLYRCRSVVLAAAATGGLAALWTNLHGAYPLGIALCGAFLVRGVVDGWRYRVWAPARRAALSLAASAAGCLVRPDPGSVLSYVWGVSSRAQARRLEEWLPTSIDTASGPALVALVLLAVALLALSRRRLHPGDLALLALFLLPAFLTQRMVIWWALVLPVGLARTAWSVHRHLRACRPPVRQSVASVPPRRMADWGAAAALAALVALCSPWTRAANPLLPPAKRQRVPVGEPLRAAHRLAELDAAGRLYCPMPWGAYFSWYSDGRLQPFVDARVDFYPDDVWCDYLQIARGDAAAMDLIRRYAITVVVCDRRSDGRLIAGLAADPSWRTVYCDPLAQVFRRWDSAGTTPTSAPAPGR